MSRVIRYFVACFAGALAAASIAMPAAAQDTAATGPLPADEVQTSAEAEKPPLIPTSDFAGRSTFRGLKMSPDGQHIAFWMAQQKQVYLVIVNVESMSIVDRMLIGDKVEVDWIRWAGARRVLFSLAQIDTIRGEERRFTRLFVSDLGTRGMRYVGLKAQTDDGDDIVHLDRDGQYVLLAMRKSVYDYPSVYRLSLTDAEAKHEVVQKAKDGVWIWSADEAGVVRMGLGYSKRRLRVWYRPDETSRFKQIARFRPDDDESNFWDVLRIVGGSDEGYILDEDDDGRVGLQKINYATRERIETVYSNPDWDLTEAIIGRDGEPVAAFYTDDRNQVVWFDEEDQALQAQLEAALPGQKVWIISRARGNQRMLVSVGGEADPGALYIYTPKTKTLKLLAEYRPALRPALLVNPKPVTIAARDGVQMRAYLTLPKGREPKALPLIILPHGGPYGVRDRLRYDDEVQLLANRGYAVLQPNFRGSSGYGKAFSELGAGQIGRGMQDDLDDAMDWAVAQGYADPSRVCVVGSSYGGYAAMWAVTRNPERYRCAASFAGVADMKEQLRYDKDYFTRKGARKWASRVEGDEGFDLDTISPSEQVRRLARPLLLAHGTEDSVVPFSQHKVMEKAARRTNRPVETLVIEDEGHSFSSKENEQVWYDALTAFLAKHNPAD